MRKFLVIAAARTGSTLLMQVVAASPNVRAQYELFHGSVLFVDGEDWSHDIERRDRDPFAWLEEIWARSPHPVCGFKIFPNQNDAIRDALIADESVAKIVLFRENYLAVYSSLLISTATNRWSQPTHRRIDLNEIDSKSHEWDAKVTFDEADFVKRYKNYLAFYEDSINKLNAANQNFLFIEYGETLNEGLMRRIFPFIGAAQPAEIRVGMKKNNSSNVIGRFTNVDDVRDYLRRVGKRDWMDENFVKWS